MSRTATAATATATATAAAIVALPLHCHHSHTSLPRAMSGTFLTAKALAIRMKSKGLQRLRWYCQMCEKQCRDEAGFKCHTRSEAHLRQMALFAQSADTFVERFSQQFSDGYVAVLRRQGGRRVKANHVYTAYIADKEHVHMNSTKWDTLSSFVSYLGKQRLAEVEQDEHGDWLVKYVDRDPKVLARQQELSSRAQRERSREQQEEERIQAEMEAASRQRHDTQQHTATEARLLEDGALAEGADTSEEREKQRQEDERRQREWLSGDKADGATSAASAPAVGRLQIKLTAQHSGVAAQSGRGAAERGGAAAALLVAVGRQRAGREELKPAAGLTAAAQGVAAAAGTRKRSAVELVMEEEQRRKLSQRTVASSAASAADSPPASASASAPSTSQPPSSNGPAPWLSVGLVVKCLNRSSHSGRCSGQKGRVVAVDDGGYTAVVAPLDSTLAPLRVHQSELQTVIPAVGGALRIVAGGRRVGDTATLLGLSDDQAVCSVQCVSDGLRLEAMEFETVCKLAAVEHTPQPPA